MSHKFLKSAGLVALLVLVTVSVAFAAHVISSSVSVSGGQTIATYQVISDPGLNGISHVVIPGCAEIQPVVTGCSVPIVYGADPTTGVTGWKCDAGGSYTLQFSWPGSLEATVSNASIKYGTSVSLVPVDAVTCVPQAVVIERFEYLRGAFEWDSLEDGLGYWIIDKSGRVIVPWLPAKSPGNWGWFRYKVYPRMAVGPGLYILMAQDVTGRTGEVARLVVPQPTFSK